MSRLESAKSALTKRLETQLAELQDRLSRDVIAFEDTSTAAQKRRWEQADSVEGFGRLYAPHYFTSESADFHRDLDRMVAHDDRHVFIVHGPREHAKSTRARIGLIKQVLTGAWRYPLLVSEELKLSKEHLNYIAAELTANRRIQADYEVDVIRHSQNEGSLQVRITPKATGVAHHALVQAESYKTSVKGKLFMQHRPDAALIDDFEDTESSRNVEIARRKVTWVLQELYPAIAGGPIIWLGNTARDTSALYQGMLEAVGDETLLRRYMERGTQTGGNIPISLDRLTERLRNGSETGVRGDKSSGPTPDPETERDSDQEDAIEADLSVYIYRATTETEDGIVYLWPERYDPRWYQRMRATMGDARFESEMNGHPQSRGVFFDEDWFPIYDELPARLRHYMWADPAFGTSGSGSYKAVVVCATDRQRYYVVDAWLDNTSPTVAMIEAMYELVERHDELRHGGYENDFAQDDRLARDFQDAAERHGWPLPVAGDTNQRGSKEARIESMEPIVSQERLLWPTRAVVCINHDHVQRLKSQMLAWPDGADDGPDALESCIARMRYQGATDRLGYQSLGKRRGYRSHR